MADAYLKAALDALSAVQEILLRAALPLAVLIGLLAVAVAVSAWRSGGSSWDADKLKGQAASALAYLGLGLFGIVCWSALKQAKPLAAEAIEWRDSAESSANPKHDEQPSSQYGPVAAAMVEHKYTRTLTLPPSFLERIGAEGVGALAPYLTDPTAEGVVKLVDTFRRSGKDVVFTREATRRDEEPVSFRTSRVKTSFHRLEDQTFDLDFQAAYVFGNDLDVPKSFRFQFTLPQSGGTVREIGVTIGGKAAAGPNDRGIFEWTGTLDPGETKEALVRYKMLGGREWQYDLGSNRRRVQEFSLEAKSDGPVEFMRGSLNPNSRGQGAYSWKLANVVTSQHVGLRFPPDVAGREAFLQALGMFPLSLALFAIGAAAFSKRSKSALTPAKWALGLGSFALGLLGASILANYFSPPIAVVILPLAGALAGVQTLGRWSLVAAIPAALVPATFLSPTHSGLLLLILAALALVAVMGSSRPSARATLAD